MEAENAVIQLRLRIVGHHQTLGERNGRILACNLQRERGPADTWISGV